MADALDQSQIIRFFHGPEEGIDSKIADNTITPADFIVTTEDDLVYIDQDKSKHSLGSSKTKETHEVNLGGSIGGLSDGTEIPVGTTLDEFISMLTAKSIPAVYTAPAVTCRVSSGNQPSSYEVGTEINTTIQGVFTQNDAGALESIQILKNGSQVFSQTASPVTTDPQEFTLGDETVTFTAKATYGEGQIKNDNLGQPSPDGHIQAGNKTSSGVSFVGKRNLFYGTGVGSVPSITSEAVRALAGKKLGPTNGTVFDINIAIGQQYVIFAYPATLRDVSQVMYVETNDTGMAASFAKQTVSVQGANGAAGADYKVYSYGMAVPASAPMTFKVTI